MIQITRNPITTIVSYSFASDAQLAHAVVSPKSGILLNEKNGMAELVLVKSEFQRWQRLMRPVALYCVHCDSADRPFWVRQYEINDADGEIDCEFCGAKCARQLEPAARVIPSWVTEYWDAVNGMVKVPS